MMRCGWWATAALALWACGCSGGASGGKVTGTVYLDGKALPSAGVHFWPKDDLELGVYSGKTDAEGRFEMSSRAGKWVKPGRYIALISLDVKKDGTVPGPGDDWNMLKRPGALHNILPARYNNRSQPAFTVEVVEGTNDFPFELTSEP